MKKMMISLVSVVLSIALCLPLAACGKKGDDKLTIVVLGAGYGSEWINDIVQKYTAETGVEVNLTAEYEVKPIITKNMASRNNPDDLYISTDTAWKTYAAQGKFASLDDLLDETVDGVKLKDKISPEYADSIYYTDRNGEKHTYRLPWTSGTGGIFYNKKMFEEYGWEVPETYEDLLALCDVITGKTPDTDPDDGVTHGPIAVEGDRTRTIKPFVFTGANEDYFDYAVYTWWAQLAGKDAIEEFLQYSDASVFATTDSANAPIDSTYSKLKQATAYWSQLVTPANSVDGSLDKSNHTAQQDFVNGYAAMMFNGDWLYNEVLGYKNEDVNLDNFELGLMQTPVMPDAVSTDISYVIGEDQFIAIPASSDKIREAKDFIKYVVSDDGISTFFNKGHGRLAYQSTTPIATDDPFMQNLLDFRTAAPVTFTNFSDSLLYLSNVIDIWSIASLRPYRAVYQGNNTIDAAFKSIQTETAREWNTWKTQVGMK